MKGKLIKSIIAIALLGSINACSIKQFDQQNEYAKTSLKQGLLTVDNMHSEVSHNKIWVSAKRVAVTRDAKDAEWLKDRFVLNEHKPISPQEFIALSNEAYRSINVTATPIAAAVMGIGIQSQTTSVKPFELRSRINSNVASAFDNVTSQMGLSWRVIGDHRIEIYKYEEKTLYIKSINTSIDYQTDQNVDSYVSKSAIKGDVWADLERMIDGIKTQDDGASVTYSPSISVIVIRDVPDVIKRVESVVDTLNEIMSRQVVLDINLIRYRNNSGNSAIADIQTAFATANRSIDIAGMAGTLLGSSTATAAIINPQSKFNGSATTLQALRDSGEASDVVHRSVITKNNTPVPFSIDISKTYLQSFGGGSVSNGVATAPTATPGTAHSVVSIFVYPRIMSSEEVLLQVDIKISSIDFIRTITTGSGATSSTIEAPEETKLLFSQTLSLQDGATLVLTGSSVDRSESKDSVGIFGGSKSSNASHEELVFMITPYIIHKGAGSK